MQENKSNDYSEEINITTNTSYLNEKSLKKDEKLSATISELILCTFTSSLFTQIVLLIKSSFSLFYFLPNILLLFLIAIFLLNKLNKRLSIKSLLVILSILIGIIISL